ncbi:MAG TPA: DoxX family protein [Chryseolinea sp.]
MPVFSTSISILHANICLLLVRVTVGGIMLVHGIPKLNKLTAGGEIKFADPFGFGPQISLGLAVFAEVVCSIFIILGLGTRLAAIPLIITMAVAAFYAHANDPFATKEKPILLLIIFVMLMVFGSGRYSIDRLMTKTNLQ